VRGPDLVDHDHDCVVFEVGDDHPRAFVGEQGAPSPGPCRWPRR
jgi:hypothetical protein